MPLSAPTANAGPLAEPAPSTAGVDTRRRQMSGVLLVAGAPIIIASFLTNPEAETSAERLRAATQHATATEVSILLGTAGILLLIPGLAGLARALRFRSPRLASSGVAITLAAFVCLLANFGVNAVYLELAKAHVATGPSVALIDRMESGSLAFGILFGVFILGHLIGPILLGIALARTHFVPLWAAILLPVGSLGHFLSHAINSRPLDVVSFLALALSFAVAGLKMISTPTTAD